MGERVEPVEDGRGWREWGEYVHDMLRGYPMALVIAAMAVLAASESMRMADAASPDTAAMLNGAAAVVSALAAVISARRTGKSEAQAADHEARLRVLEDREARRG